MDHLEYAKKWITRPIFQGLETDKQILQSMISEIEDYRQIFDRPIAWAKTNDRGDLFDLRLLYNPYEKNIVPLYMGHHNNVKQGQ